MLTRSRFILGRKRFGFNTMRDFELQSLKSFRSVPLVTLRIINLSFKETNVTVSLKDSVSAVKDKFLGGEHSKECSSYKLLLTKTSRILADDKTLEEENIEDNGKKKERGSNFKEKSKVVSKI